VKHHTTGRLARSAAVVTASLACVANADTLFVTGVVPVSSGDAAVINQLEALGEVVTVVKDSASTTGHAGGKDLVVISDSVAPGKVNNKFTQVAVPVLVFEPYLYDNLGMTGAVAGTDFGGSGLQDSLRMSGTHPLTAGLAGVVAVGTAPVKFSWGKPGAAATVAATLKNNTSRPTIFAYRAGDLLASGTTAPARRVALYLNTGATDTWNAIGRLLFATAAQWARDGTIPPPPEAVRILPLGDSITRGRIGHWSYRRDLEAALTDAGCSFDFVGTEYGPSSGPGEPLIDRDNEGHSGLRNEHDWALIHVGTNDVLQGTSISAARTEISKIIDKLRGANPNVGILLAQVIPNRPENEAAVAALNDAIASLGVQKDTPASPVIVVDQYSGYSSFTQNYDQIHPNDAGEAMIAGRWFAALHPRIAAYCQQ
jgi:acyl-CoA thioesterase I